MPDLFAEHRRANVGRAAPLAVRMRPRVLDEVVGQSHFLGDGKLLRRMIDADRLQSVLFYGPPGTGKTTLAEVIARHTRSAYVALHAAAANVKEVRVVLDAARERLETAGRRTVLFLDEIHRFNRAQQDVLLNDVEAGVVTLLGATTENPFFAVNAALVSRSQIFQFGPLSLDEIRVVLSQAIRDPDRGYGTLDLTVDDAALDHWAATSDGDARRALNALEVAVLSLPSDCPKHVTLDVAEQSIQRKAIVYDPTGDGHYDAASVFIKSMRGGDVDAAIYWLAHMVEAGEDPRFIARRVVIFASEDVGMADPQAIVVASACFDTVLRVGMPEGRLALAQAVVYCASAPKNRAVYDAIEAALVDVREERSVAVPPAMADSHYPGAARLGRGRSAPQAAGDPDPPPPFGVSATYYAGPGLDTRAKPRMNPDSPASGED